MEKQAKSQQVNLCVVPSAKYIMRGYRSVQFSTSLAIAFTTSGRACFCLTFDARTDYFVAINHQIELLLYMSAYVFFIL